MKIVKFEALDLEEKRKEIIEEIQKLTSFIVVYPHDLGNKIGYMRVNIDNGQCITALEVTKACILAEVVNDE